MESPLWCIKYRPKSWDEFSGQDNVIAQLRKYAESGTFPNMIVYGPPGTGKSAAIDLYSHQVLGDAYETNFKLLNIRDLWSFPISSAKRTIQQIAKLAPDERSKLDEYMSLVYQEAKDTLRIRGSSRTPNRSQLLQAAIRIYSSTYTLSDMSVKLLVLDEADAMNMSMQQALRRTMEIYSDVTRFIMITPSISGWSPAILSRSLMLRFQCPPQETVQQLIENIAGLEKVEIDETAISAIARESKGNLRRAINLLQVASVSKTRVTEDIVYEIYQTPLVRDIREMLTHALSGKFLKSRTILRNLIAVEGYSLQEITLEIERDIGKRAISPEMLGEIMDRLAEIDFRVIQARNPFIQLTAFLASLGEYGLAES